MTQPPAPATSVPAQARDHLPIGWNVAVRIAQEAARYAPHRPVEVNATVILMIDAKLAASTEPVAALPARIEELEKDAARYRWLRDGALTNRAATIAMWEANSCDELDTAIDAALNKQESNQ